MTLSRLISGFRGLEESLSGASPSARVSEFPNFQLRRAEK